MSASPKLLSLGLVLAAAWFASGPRPAAGQESSAEVRFVAADVYVDAGVEPLAAWQVEIVDPTLAAKIAGVEGGEHEAFAEPPHYDPRALQESRIVLAAYSTSRALPSGRVRVARLHLRVAGPDEPAFTVKLTAAAGPDGRRLAAQATIEPR